MSDSPNATCALCCEIATYSVKLGSFKLAIFNNVVIFLALISIVYLLVHLQKVRSRFIH
jgi:hypothetical protein